MNIDRTPQADHASAHIAFGEVRHTRLRPARNAFHYPAYFLRLPLRDLAPSLSGLRWISHNRWNLLSFQDRDHVEASGMTPLESIERLLVREGITDVDGDIWLHTFPRVLGYVFNPVSFWFCHRADGALRAVLCAVNNTFGESHRYLLAHESGAPLRAGEELAARKVFHVSPFCAIEGCYRFRFMLAHGRSVARIDYDDAAGPLLLTSVSGVLAPLSDANVARAFVRFPLFTFGVVARIHWQALKLWRKRVPFFSKPEPPAVEVTR